MRLSNGKLDIVVTRLGSTLASIVMTDDPEKLNPLWDPTRIAREQGRQATFTGSAGHFVCVDGFGPGESLDGLEIDAPADRLLKTLMLEWALAMLTDKSRLLVACHDDKLQGKR